VSLGIAFEFVPVVKVSYRGRWAAWPFLRPRAAAGDPVTPTRSQYTAALAVIGRISESDTPNHESQYGSAQFLNDAVGIGKTMTAMMVMRGIHHISLCLLEAQRLKSSSPIPPILFGSREYFKEQFPIPQKVSYCNITVGTSNLKETELGSHNNSLSVDKDAPANEGGSIGSQMSRNDKPSSPSRGRSSSAAKPPGPELL
jgi:hypothetical protein